MRLAYALTATDMRMRENDVTLGIPNTSYICQYLPTSALFAMPGNTGKCHRKIPGVGFAA